MQSPLPRLAGKRGRGEPKPGHEWHPLICHMLDVAAVALAMWDGVLSRRARDLLCDGMGLDEAAAREWVGFIAGLHDTGKCSRNFQGRIGGAKDQLAGTGLEIIKGQSDPYHGKVTSGLLGPILVARYRIEGRLADRIAMVTGGHHGRFEFARPSGVHPRIGEGRQNPKQRAAWSKARGELVAALGTTLGVRAAGPTRLTNRAAMVLGGFISVADWLGSAEEFFPYTPNGADDLGTYFAGAKDKAARALSGLHWGAWKQPPPGQTFVDLFKKFPPNALQQVVEEIAGEARGLVLIEAPMGLGKTECAFFLVDRWNAVDARGAYIALPTQATANQMHDRTKAFLGYDDKTINLVLAHSGVAFLDDDDLKLLPANIDGDESVSAGTVGAGEWFVKGSKRRLLAPYAVGTVDQSLLAVLQVKHVFVRLFALAGKVVVIDEVHAYDAYMNVLLERLLQWLGALGSPVVLLSATLPAAKREALIRAYLAGEQGVAPEQATITEWAAERYPRVMWTKDTRVLAKHIDIADADRRKLHLKWVRDDDDDVADLLKRELAQGGCAAVICNTVRRAQKTYKALRKAFGKDEVGLFHARFVHEDRERIENACRKDFGPAKDGESTDVRRPRYVLVATQVIEQSLDLDFDVMISDPAPIDLLLQRSGRLQRHRRKWRPPGPPTLYIRWAEPDAPTPPAFDGGTTYVYDEHILLRTWACLRGRHEVTIPDDVEPLIELVYPDKDVAPPDDASAELRSRWEDTLDTMNKKARHDEREAGDRRLKPPGEGPSLVDYTPEHQLAEESRELHAQLRALTRLTQPSVQVIVLPHDSPLVPLSDVAPLSHDTVRELFRHSISVSSRRGYDALQDSPVPATFTATSALSNFRRIVLDEDGKSAVNGVVFRYDSQIGLEAESHEG